LVGFNARLLLAGAVSLRKGGPEWDVPKINDGGFGSPILFCSAHKFIKQATNRFGGTGKTAEKACGESDHRAEVRLVFLRFTPHGRAALPRGGMHWIC